MNDLIYLCVNGPQYRAMLDVCLGSLRRQGQFTGDIMVFCPDLCPVIQAACDRHQAIPRVIQWNCPQMVERAYALRHMEVAVYDTVTCLDVDVVACGPLTPLFAGYGHISVCEEPWQTYRTQPAGMYIGSMLPNEIEHVADMHPINVGVISWPSELHGALRDQWISLIETKDVKLGYPWGWDQATFCRFASLQWLPCVPFDPLDVGNATKEPQSTWKAFRLIHFAGHRDRLRFMQELANETAQG